MTEKTVQENITSCFTYFRKHKAKWDELERDFLNAINPLSNIIEQYSNCEKFDTENTEYEQLPFVRDNLLGILQHRFEDERESVNKIICQLNKLNHELRNKILAMERSTADLNWCDDNSVLIRGSPCQPELKTILKWALFLSEYYSSRNNSIYESFKEIDIHKLNSVDKLRSSVHKIKDDTEKIEEILLFTSNVEKNIHYL